MIINIACEHFRNTAAKIQKSLKTCKKVVRMAPAFAFVNYFCYLCIHETLTIRNQSGLVGRLHDSMQGNTYHYNHRDLS